MREDFLQQFAFDDVDGYTPLDKQYELLRLVFVFEDKAKEAIEAGADINDIATLPVRERIGRAKAVPTADYKEEFKKIEAEITQQLDEAVRRANEA